jgi:hypothetical protein
LLRAQQEVVKPLADADLIDHQVAHQLSGCVGDATFNPAGGGGYGCFS